MSEFTIFLLYLLAAVAFGSSRLPRFTEHSRTLSVAAGLLTAIGVSIHCATAFSEILTAGGISLSLGNAASMIGLELALIGLIAGLEPSLRGISAGLLILAALTAALTGVTESSAAVIVIDWQVRAHIVISLLSYGLLTVGAIVAVYALVQERRLRAGNLSSMNRLFAPLETTERLLFGIAGAGFVGLALAILSGFTFVENLFAQHLAHKTAFSILALCVFAALLAGRHFAGWRGARAIKLYLGGFLLLFVAYFGTRFILEQLSRSWS